jgi:hypothetical protein
MTILLGLMAALGLFVPAPAAQAQNPELQKKLQDQYTTTKLTDDRTQVVTAGSILTLKVDGLVLVPMSAAADTSGNTYKDGKITLSAAGKTNEVGKKAGVILSHVPFGVPKAPSKTNLDTRKFVAGEKLNVTKITINNDGSVAFELASYQAYTDANIYYRGTLTFPLAKGAAAPTDDKVISTVAEVFSVAPAEASNNQNQGADAGHASAPRQDAAPQSGSAPSTPAPQPAQPTTTTQYADIPPPPPPPAAPSKVEIGMTIDQVTTLYGQPDSVVDLGSKVLYQYKSRSLKITFVNGKVADAN